VDGGDGARRQGAGVASCTYLPQGVNYIVLVAGHRGAGFSRGRRGLASRAVRHHLNAIDAAGFMYIPLPGG
jgi:hypothetical protein